MESLEKQAERAHGLYVRPTGGAPPGVISIEGVRKRGQRGRLERVAPRLYRVPGSVPTARQRLRAAVLAAGPDAVASHFSAAALWKIPGFDESDMPIEVTRPRGRKHQGLVGRVHESRRLPDSHRRVVDGIAVTSPARTLFDLCGSRDCHPKRAERAIANALNAKLVRFGELETVLVQVGRRGRRGSALFRRILEAAGADDHRPTESELEALVLAVLKQAGLPLPECQVVVGGSEGPIGRVDFLYRPARLVIEGDSERFHASWLDGENDRRRDALLIAAGYQVIRVTWNQLRTEPDVFTAAVDAVLSR